MTTYFCYKIFFSLLSESHVSDESSTWEMYSWMEYVFIPWVHCCGVHALVDTAIIVGCLVLFVS